MAKSLKSILGNDKKLEGVKSSSTKPLNLGGYTPKAGDEQKFVAKHSVEKFADRAGNGDEAYIAKTKEASYQKQNPNVYEDAMSDTENLPAYGPQGSVPASPATEKKKKKKISESKIDTVYTVLEHIASSETVFKFKNGEKAVIDSETALSMWEIFDSLTEENKAKFIEVAFNSPEEFYEIAELKG
jgi:hypothetical protein